MNLEFGDCFNLFLKLQCTFFIIRKFLLLKSYYSKSSKEEKNMNFNDLAYSC